jgi:hypothetical protein
MPHKIHNVGVASQIGEYSDAVEIASAMRGHASCFSSCPISSAQNSCWKSKSSSPKPSK